MQVQTAADIKQKRYSQKMENHVKAYFDVYKPEVSPLMRFLIHARMFFVWVFKLFLPDFLVGHPNLFDNVKILLTEKKFKPLRSVFAIWFVFFIVLMVLGAMWLNHAPSADTGLGSWVQNDWSGEAGQKNYTFLDNLEVKPDGSLAIIPRHDWYNPDWRFRKTLTFALNEGIEEKYIYITIPYVSGMLEDLRDVRLTDLNNNPVDFSRVQVINENDIQIAVVKETLSALNSNILFVYFGNAASKHQINFIDETERSYINIETELSEKTEFAYEKSGTIVSNIFDNKIPVVGEWGRISMTQTGGGQILAKARTSPYEDMSGAREFSQCSTLKEGEDISSNPCINDGDRFIQYELVFVPGDGSTPILKQLRIDYGDVNFPPDQPKNLGPAAGVAVARNPVLSSSEFHDLNIHDEHILTRWKVDNNSDFSSPEWIRVSSGAETSIQVNVRDGKFAGDALEVQALAPDTLYYWQVQYQDSSGAVSAFSEPTSFITMQTFSDIDFVSVDVDKDLSIIIPTLEELEYARTLANNLFTQGERGRNKTELEDLRNQIIYKIDGIELAIKNKSETRRAIVSEYEEVGVMLNELERNVLEHNIEQKAQNKNFVRMDQEAEARIFDSSLAIMLFGGFTLLILVLLSLWHHQLLEMGEKLGIDPQELNHLRKRGIMVQNAPVKRKNVKKVKSQKKKRLT